MNEPFVPKQNFDGYYQKAQEIVQEVKEINDEIQATDEADFERMKEVLETSRTTQLNLADSLKIVFERLDRLANLSEQKKKLKQLKDQYTKEINRYKIIQKNLVEQGYEVRRQTLHRQSAQLQNPQKRNVQESTVTLKQSQIEKQQYEELVEIDQLEIDNAVIREKKKSLKQNRMLWFQIKQ